MLEFLFGWVIGVWMGQQFPLPNVQIVIQKWWLTETPAANEADAEKAPEEDKSVPVFTGTMPAST